MPLETPSVTCLTTAALHRFTSGSSTDETCRGVLVHGWPSLPAAAVTAARVPRKRQTEISKAMTVVLRHRAKDLGLPIRSDGFLCVYELLGTPELSELRCTVKEVYRVAQDSKKGRFALGEVDGALVIRATQGHSMREIAEEELLEPVVLGAPDFPTVVVHGTRLKRWRSIKEYGLLAGGWRGQSGRNHVHFADGWPMSARCKSGMPSNSEIGIFLGLRASLSRGLRLWRSENGVILTPGFDGAVPAELFDKVIRFSDGKHLWPERSVSDSEVHLGNRRVPDDPATSIGCHFVPPLRPVGVAGREEDDNDLTSVDYSPDCCSDDLGLDPLDLCAVSGPEDSEPKDVQNTEVKAASSSARDATGSLLVAPAGLDQVPAGSPITVTASTASEAMPSVPAVVPAEAPSPSETPGRMVVYAAFDNARGVPGYLDLRVGDEVVVHYTGVTDEDDGWVYGELVTGRDEDSPLGWFPALSLEWQDLRTVIRSYGPDEGKGYLPLMEGEQVIILHTDTSGDTVWYYGEAADDCSQRGWFPSMVCDGYRPSRRAAARAERGGDGGRGVAACGGP